MSELATSIIGVVRNGAGSLAFASRFGKQPLELHREDDATITITVYDSGGARFDLTACALVLTVRGPSTSAPASPPAIVSGATIASPATGQGVFEISGAQTKVLTAGAYEYDVVLVDGANKRTHVVPLSSFTLLGSAGTSEAAPVTPAPFVIPGRGPIASRPLPVDAFASGTQLYFATDEGILYFTDGFTWKVITVEVAP